MHSRSPYHVAVAVISALALSFAAAVESASAYASAAADSAHARALVADLVEAAPSEYFSGGYQKKVRENERLPVQF